MNEGSGMPPNEKRILVVDDDEGIRCSLARILRSRYDVRVAKDGQEAIDLAQGFHPDLLLTDVRMPVMDGVEAFARLREQFPALVSIFMTAYSASDQTVEAEERGALSVLAKPLDLERLMQLVEMALGSAPVLVADDDPDMRKSIARAIRASGIEVETAGSLRDAIRSLRQRPDRVVVADVFLSDGFGYELLGETSEQDEDQPTPMILITGHTEWLKTDLADAIRAKAVCLTKPIDVQALIEHVNR